MKHILVFLLLCSSASAQDDLERENFLLRARVAVLEYAESGRRDDGGADLSHPAPEVVFNRGAAYEERIPVRFDGNRGYWDNPHLGEVYWPPQRSETNWKPEHEQFQWTNGLQFPLHAFDGAPGLEYRDGFMYYLDAGEPASETYVVEYFGADWCPGCRQQKPIMQRLKAAGMNVEILDVDRDGGYSGTIPYTRIRVGGEIVWQRIGIVSERAIRHELESICQWDSTPAEDVDRAIALLDLQPGDVLIDPGCGDGRVLAAAGQMGVEAHGIEIDAERAERARQNGLSVVTGDARNADWGEATVAYVYLYVDIMAALKPKLEQLDRVVSYKHAVPGLAMRRDGEFYVWEKPVESSEIGTWYGGSYYTPENYGAHALSCMCYPMCQYLVADWVRQGWTY